MLIPPGTYRLKAPVDLPRNIQVVGQQAVAEYLSESGAGEKSLRQRPMTTEGLRQLSAEAIALLGDRYSKLRASDERGLSSPTPPLARHRLVDLIRHAEESASKLATQSAGDPVTVDANRVSELAATVDMLHRWRKHPAHTSLVATLANDTEGQHTVMLLGIASYLVDSGNGVGIVVGGGEAGRIPYGGPRHPSRSDRKD